MALTAQIQKIEFKVGDTVSVHYRIIEKEVVAGKTKKEKKEEVKDRIQAFEGIVIAIRGAGNNKNFIVRRIGIGNVGIERIFPLLSPWIKKIVVKKKGHVRRAKLYYLRDKSSKIISKMGDRVNETVESVEQSEVKSAEVKAVEPLPENAKPLAN